MQLIPIDSLTARPAVCDELFACPVCDRIAQSEQQLQAHLDLMHPGWAQTICQGFLAMVPRENG